MSFSYWFSKRLNIRKGAPASTSTGVIIAVAGVALALMVMELSLAVSAGFKHEIERKVLGFDAPVSVLPPYDYFTAATADELRITDTLTSLVKESLPEGSRIVPTFRRQAILKTESDFMAVECQARGSAHDDAFERGNMVEGRWPDFRGEKADDSIVISEPMATKLGTSVGDRLYLYFFVNNAPKARRAFVAGLYRSNFGEYDNSVIYTSLGLMQGLSDDESSLATSIAVEGLGKDDILPASEGLQASLLDAYREGRIGEIHPVDNIFNSGAVFFSWLDLLDTNVVVIFILMVCVAAFTLISSLFIIILDRVPTIGTLRALGASHGEVSRIFINLALKLVGLGMIIGNAVALGIILLQNATRFLPLDPQMYYLDHVPFEISWTTVVLLNAGVAAGSWLILILPARLAARIDPAATMRYE